ncbi:MAG: LAGLIDADG family homing endonuclease [Blastocatellia bacterium]
MKPERKPDRAVKLNVIQPRSVLNRSGMGGFTLNPYVGCVVGCAYCLEGDTLITMADGTTGAIRDVSIGESILGVRRADHDGGWLHRYTQAIILNKVETLKPAFEIALENNTRVICSSDHRWLTDRGWKYTTGAMQGPERRPYLTVNNFIQGIGQAHKTPPQTAAYKKGYLAGIIRGDGLLAKYDYSGKYKRQNRKHVQVTDVQHQFRLALSDFDALKRAKTYLSEFGVLTTEFEFRNGSSKKPMRAIRNHSRRAFDAITALIVDEPSAEWLRGWLAGIFDAEGSFSGVVRISNTDEQILKVTRQAFASLGLSALREDRAGAASMIRLRGGLGEVAKFFQLAAPAISRKCDLSETTLRHSTRVVEIRPLGRILPMFDITTSTENFIANGLVSHNCYVPHMKHKQLEERKWGTYVDVKEGVPELLDNQLGRLRQPTRVFMSTATDPYQPVEERYQITRRILEVFARHPQHSLFILTKQTLVERDADLIARLPRAAVGMSISVIDDRLSEIIEPWAAPTSGRLATIRRLSERAIPTYVLWAPAFVPVPMSREFVRAAMTKIAESRTQALSLDSLNYRSRQPVGLLRRLARDGHAPATAAQAEMLRQEAKRHGLARRLDLVAPESEIAELQPLLPFE